MSAIRWLWIVVVVVGCTVAALAGGLSLSYYGEPDPRTASRTAILRWLATSDVSGESPETQQALVDRLALELRNDPNFSDAGEASAAQQAMLQKNSETLKARWFVSRVERHADLQGTERTTHLDEQIATLLAWAKVDASLQTRKADFFDDIERWIKNESDPPLRAKMTSAVRDGLVRWLATHDVTHQSPWVRRELALVIADALNDGVDLSAIQGEQSGPEREMLRANGHLLLEAWVHAQAEAYSKLAADERASFIDARMDEVVRWRIAELFDEGGAQANAPPAMGLARLGKEFETWLARAEPQQREQLRQFFGDVQARLVQRLFQSLRGQG